MPTLVNRHAIEGKLKPTSGTGRHRLISARLSIVARPVTTRFLFETAMLVVIAHDKLVNDTAFDDCNTVHQAVSISKVRKA